VFTFSVFYRQLSGWSSTRCVSKRFFGLPPAAAVVCGHRGFSTHSIRHLYRWMPCMSGQREIASAQ